MRYCISSQGLFGIIPPQLSNLTSLVALDLSNNSFFGQIPSELGLSSLQHIILVGNIINGTIPNSLSHCRRLQSIMFQNNKLTGQLPRELGRLHGLKFLDVSMNNLTGVIPNELGRLNNLVTLQLSENQLSGEIPFSIFNISTLKFLSLTLNRLVGKLPSKYRPYPSQNKATCQRLEMLVLARTALSGSIPKQIFELPQLKFCCWQMTV